MCRRAESPGVAARRDGNDGYEPALKLRVVIGAWIASEVTITAIGAVDLRLEAEELVECRRALLERAGVGVVNGERCVHGLENESIADSQRFIRGLGAELRVRVDACSGESLIAMRESVEREGEARGRNDGLRIRDHRYRSIAWPMTNASQFAVGFGMRADLQVVSGDACRWHGVELRCAQILQRFPRALCETRRESQESKGANQKKVAEWGEGGEHCCS